MSRITSINLSGKKLTAIPDDVFTLGNLRKLKLSGNQIKQVGSDILKLKRLKVLDLSNNKLSQLHAGIFKLPCLETLVISNNAIKTLPKQIANSKLKILIANNNNLINANLNLLPNGIIKLNLSNNNISSVEWLDRLGYLKSLWLGGNSIPQEMIDQIASNRPNLVRFYAKQTYSGIKSNRGNMLKQTVASRKIEPAKKAMSLRSDIFISYSHQDKQWLTRLQTHLKVLQNLYGKVKYWDDTQIGIGDTWLKEIEKNLNSASIAILLISTDFLASDFVMRKEVPQLLERAKNRGVRIMPLILSPCLFTDSIISQYQAVNTPEEALEELSKPQQEKVYIKLMQEVKKFIPH